MVRHSGARDVDSLGSAWYSVRRGALLVENSPAHLPDGLGSVVKLLVALLTLGGIYLRTKSSPAKHRVFVALAGFGAAMALAIAAWEAVRHFSKSSADGLQPPAPTARGTAGADGAGEPGSPPIVKAYPPSAEPAAKETAGTVKHGGPDARIPARTASKASGNRNDTNSNKRVTEGPTTNSATVTGSGNIVNSGNVLNGSVIVNSATVNGDHNVTNSGNAIVNGSLTNSAEVGHP
jgi:hypothetical protein